MRWNFMPPCLIFLHECWDLTWILMPTTSWWQWFLRRDYRDVVPYVPVPSLSVTFLVFGAERLALPFPGLNRLPKSYSKCHQQRKWWSYWLLLEVSHLLWKRSHIVKSWTEQANPYLIQGRKYHRQTQYFQGIWLRPRLKHEKNSAAGSGPSWICDLMWRPPQSHQAIGKWS